MACIGEQFRSVGRNVVACGGYLLSTAVTSLVMLSLGAPLDPALAKSKRETAELLAAKVTLADAVSGAQKRSQEEKRSMQIW